MGEALVWRAETAPHMVLTPLWNCFPPPVFMQCQERQKEQSPPSQPSEGMECLSITHSEVFLVMLRFSQPGQQ